MQVDIEFEYLVEFVPARHRITQTEPSLAELTVEIAEPASVREVHRISNHVRHEGQAGPFGRMQGRMDRGCRVVEHEGRYYREHCATDRLQHLVSDRKRDAPESPFHVNRRPAFNHMLTVDRHQKVDRALDAEALARKHGGFKANTYRDDRGASVAALIVQRAAELIIHDGFVFVPTSEPVIAVVEDKDMDDRHRISLAVVEARPAGWSAFEPHRSFQLDIIRGNVFALSEHGAAREFAEATAEATDSVFKDGVDIEEMSPGDLSFGGTWPLFRVAKDIVHGMGHKAMRMHPEVADSWADLRDAYSEFGGTCSVRLLEALDAYVASVATHGLPGMPGAEDCAAAALSGRRDLSLETSTEIGRHMSQLIQAYEALSRSERAGLSWARSASLRPAPAESGGLEAVEILSASDLARTAEHLNCIPPALQPPPGGRIIAVTEPTPHSRSVVGVVALDSRDLPEWSFGRGGNPAGPLVSALAREYVTELVPREPEFDDRDVAAFAL